MTHFEIITVGRNCADVMLATLGSIASQTEDDYDVRIVDDASDGPQQSMLVKWCALHGERWHCRLNKRRLGAPQNQYEAIAAAQPADDDVIVWLDLDGDRFAHPGVLQRIAKSYAAGALLTYGSYLPVPASRTCNPASPFPTDVIRRNAFRTEILNVNCHFNHLRTMSGRVFKAIPPEHFRWARGPKRGDWYSAGTDYVFMTAGLELAGERHEFIPDILCLYRSDSPVSDARSHGAESTACTQDYLRHHRPLQPLAPSAPTGGDPVAMLTADERREVIRDYGKRLGLRTLVETGTNDGATPWALKGDFDRIFTIELGMKQWKAAVARFAMYPHVMCLQGDSAKVLPQVLHMFDGPALLWLDGHTSGGVTARGPKDTPVIEELEAIFATGIPHVVLVDDARLFKGMECADEWDWPNILDVFQRADAAGYSMEIVDDIIRLTPGATAVWCTASTGGFYVCPNDRPKNGRDQA